MSEFSARLKEARLRRGYSQLHLSKLVGLSAGAISMYEIGKREPDIQTLNKICDVLMVDVKDLITSDIPAGFEPLPPMKAIPLVGTIACGEPILAEQNISEYIPAPADVKADFALRCKGDSMTGAGIYDGDLVYIRKQSTVENGQIAAVRIGDEATLKRVQMIDDLMILAPENPAYKAMVYKPGTDVSIEGVAVAFMRVIER